MTKNKRFEFREVNCTAIVPKAYDNEKQQYANLFECIHWLNNLHKENEQLKEERNYFERKKCEYFNKYNKKHLDNIQLKKENEQLKQKLKEYEEILEEKSNNISQLKKKNELKEAINKIDSLVHTQEDYLAWSIIYETLTNGKPLSYRLKM